VRSWPRQGAKFVVKTAGADNIGHLTRDMISKRQKVHERFVKQPAVLTITIFLMALETVWEDGDIGIVLICVSAIYLYNARTKVIRIVPRGKVGLA
jgi:hypothetical protein